MLNPLFLLLMLILGIDIVFANRKKTCPAAGKWHGVYSGIVSLCGIIGAVLLRFRLMNVLEAEKAVKTYMDADFIRWASSCYDRFAFWITLLTLAVMVLMLWSGIHLSGKHHVMLWILCGFVMQTVTIWFAVNSINAYFDLGIYLNNLFLFEVMVLHLVNAVEYLWKKHSLS